MLDKDEWVESVQYDYPDVLTAIIDGDADISNLNRDSDPAFYDLVAKIRQISPTVYDYLFSGRDNVAMRLNNDSSCLEDFLSSVVSVIDEIE